MTNILKCDSCKKYFISSESSSPNKTEIFAILVKNKKSEYIIYE